jgi:hypothetical protein
MQLTNNYNLPLPYYQAVSYDSYKRVGDISITGLIKAPRQRILMKRHDLEIVEDASQRVWRLLGDATHVVLKRIDSINHLVEERMTAQVDGWTVAGQPDLLGPDGTLSDWKVTSVFSFLLGDKPEWTQQLNLYKWLYAQHGFEVSKLQIVAILRDWYQSKAKREEDYPRTAIHVVDIPMLDLVAIDQTVRYLVNFHKTSEDLPDDELPECTPAERWERPTTYAVKKETNVKAYRVFDNEEAARAMVEEKGKGWIVEVRPGSSVRCEEYCLAAPFCNFYQASLK